MIFGIVFLLILPFGWFVVVDAIGDDTVVIPFVVRTVNKVFSSVSCDDCCHRVIKMFPTSSWFDVSVIPFLGLSTCCWVIAMTQ